MKPWQREKVHSSRRGLGKLESIILLEILRAHCRPKSAYPGALSKTFTIEVPRWDFQNTRNLAAFETPISRAPWISSEAPNRIFFCLFLRTSTGFINVCGGHTALSIPHKPAKKEALRVSRRGPPSASPCSLLLQACSRPRDRHTQRRADNVHTHTKKKK